MEKVTRISVKCFVVLLFTLLMCLGMGISAQAVGDGGYVVAPPSGTSVSDVFRTVGNTNVDSQYTNTAIVTTDTQNQFGALWSKTQLDLTKPFSAEMYLYLGHASGKKGTLADGMTFTMHNDTTSLTQMTGGRGEGLGVYRGRKSTGGTSTVVDGSYLPNSLVIEFDTYRNTLDGWSYVGDPDTGNTGHCALLTPRANSISERDHKNTFGFTPQQKWVKFEVSWTPNSSNGGTLTYSFNGTIKQYTISSVNSVFGGSKVYWGFTGATGMYSSVQAVAITKLPSNPEAIPSATKSSVNLTTASGKANVGDTIQYTITATNSGDAASSWGGVVVSDTLPEGVTLVDNSVTVNGAAVQYTYNASTRLLTVDLGSIAGGVTKTLVFQVKVNADAYGKALVNSANVGGIKVSDGGNTVIEKTAPPVIDTVIENAQEITGTGIPGAAITVTLPNGTAVSATVNSGGTWLANVPNGVILNVGDVVSAVQQETGKLLSDAAVTTVIGDITVDPGIDVYVENLTTGEDYVTSGDVLLYNIIVSNNGTASSTWPSAYVTFYLSEYAALQENTIRINNITVTSSQYTYDSTANTLTLYLGNITGGSRVSVSFRTRISTNVLDINSIVLSAEFGSRYI